jgi:macrolide-specific efflux system membrane fusion protein
VNDVVLYQVLVDVDNKDHSLMEAMSTQVFFVEESAQDVLLVPLAAVRRTPRGAFARVPAGNEEERVKVELGIVSRTHAQIRAGLELGDAVIAGSEQSSGGEQARTFGNTSTPRIGGRRGF